MLAVIPGTGLSALHAFNATFFFSLLCEAFLLSPRLSLCPFPSKCNAIYVSRAWFAGAWEAALTAGSGTAEGRAWANSRDFPGARLPLLGSPPYFEGWNWKEWVLYLVQCFLFNLER